MRHGADVHAVMTPASQKMIGRDLMEWATGNPVVSELSGKIEHRRGHLWSRQGGPGPDRTGHGEHDREDSSRDRRHTRDLLRLLGVGREDPDIRRPGDARHDAEPLHNPGEHREAPHRGDRSAPIDDGRREGEVADVGVIVEAVIVKLTEKTLEGRTVMITGGPTIEPSTRSGS